MKPLSVTIIQSDLHWENPKANRLNFSNKIQSITEKYYFQAIYLEILDQLELFQLRKYLYK